MNDVQDNNENLTFLFRITYKSGSSFEAWFDKMEVTSTAGEITSIEWKVSAGERLRIIHIGASEIESVLQLDYKQR
ncbi:hypothetical protein D3C75_686930 [compost metagenome]